MGKKYRSNRRGTLSPASLTVLNRASLPIAAVLFFFCVCLNEEATAKVMATLLILLSLACGIFRFSRLRERVTLPLAALALVVLMDGLTLFYAPSGKFALYEFLHVVIAFCAGLLLLIFARGEGDRPGRWFGTVLEAGTALTGLLSIDLISTRLISTPVLGFLTLLNDQYRNMEGLEAGIRITSIFLNPNIFAGMIGLGVMLSLGLALSSEKRGERCFHLSCLFINALAFLLAFSMGASAAIAVGFLVYLALERRDRRAALFLLMLKTLILTGLAAALVSMTAFQPWDGFQPVPLLSVIVGAVVLCVSELFAGAKVTEKLGAGKKLPLLIGGAVAALVLFLFAAYFTTGGTALNPGEALRRAAYPAPGDYVLHAEADGAAFVVVESQNQRDTMMHTSTTLYQGSLDQAAFTVPEDSMVVYFNFFSEQSVYLSSVTYEGTGGSGSVPLGYKLLPGFIANRLQGLWANQNAIQRLVFFADGMRLFRRSPIIGLGLGSFENGSCSVQSFYYETRYVHNHYVQALLDTGVIGLVLFVGLIAVSAAAVWLERKREAAHPLTPALGAALVFMACHAATEVIFSNYAYLPFAFGVFTLIALCCGKALPVRFFTSQVRTGLLAGIGAGLIAFALPLWSNMDAAAVFQRNPTLAGLAQAASMDKFEWPDYALSYVVSTMNLSENEVDDDIRQRADTYAQRLSKLDSNLVPLYLSEYYLRTGRVEQGMAMAEKYVTYVSADPEAWQKTFDLLERLETDGADYRAGVARIKQLMDTWNAENMGEIQVSERTQAFLSRVLG